MDLAKLEMFVRVVELGSLSKASIRFDLGPSALSRQLSALEAEFHGRLLHRTGRGVRLTELGERVFPKATALLADARALSAEISEFAGVCRGTVHLACLPLIARTLVTRVVVLARERFPEVIIHASEGLGGQIERSLAEGTADLGFVARLHNDKNAEAPLAVSPLCLVGPPGDRLTSRKEIQLKSLNGIPILQPDATDQFRSSIAEAAWEAGVRFNVVAEIDSVDLMRTMAAAGVGYALLSNMAVAEDLKAGRLSAARVIDPELRRAIYLIGSPRKTPNIAAREVSRLIRQVAEDLARTGMWGDKPESAESSCTTGSKENVGSGISVRSGEAETEDF